MSKDNDNRLILLYNQVEPYIYGAIRVVKGGLDTQTTSNPFIISKTVNGREIVYGSLLESIEKLIHVISRYIDQQRNATKAWFTKKGLQMPEPHYRDGYAQMPFPESEPDEQFIHQRDLETEDTILLASIHLRTLIEAFSGKFSDQRITLYGYENEILGDVSLKDVCDVLLHHRYFVIHDMFLIDPFSHTRALDSESFFGSKVSVSDWIDGVIAVINRITVKEYMGMLRSRLEHLSIESQSKDMIFAVQNVYSLGRVVRERMEYSGSGKLLDTMFGPIGEDLFKGQRPAPGEIVDISFQFTAPRFQIGDDLLNLKIEIRFKLNEVEKVVAVDYRELLTQIARVYGDDTLISVERRTGPGAD